MLVKFVYVVEFAVIYYFLFVNLAYTLFLILSVKYILRAFYAKRYGFSKNVLATTNMPPVSAILPVYNEANSISKTIESLLAVTYKNFEIVVVNDGSSDQTFETLRNTYRLKEVVSVIRQSIKTEEVKGYYVSETHSNLVVIDTVHSGKSDSLNVGINASKTPLFLTIDADTVFGEECLETIVSSMLSKPHTIAEGGSVYVLNACKTEGGKMVEPKCSFRPIIALQTAEYLRAFLFGRACWSGIGGPFILPGAITLFETDAAREVNGFDLNTLGEDMEIIVHEHQYMRDHKYPYNIGFSPAAVAWTHVPETIDALWKQRNRWQQGLMESLFMHFRMFFNPRYRASGLITHPFHFFVEFLGPILELVGYTALIVAYFLRILDWQYALLFFVATWGFSTVLTMSTALLSYVTFNMYKKLRYLLWLVVVVAIESFGYRQTLAICRSYTSIAFILRKIFRSKNKKRKGWATD